MGVPIVYRKGTSQILASYDYVDIASGTGYINFYAAMTTSGATLTNFSFYSNPASTPGTSTGASYLKKVDIDFDVLMNKPFVFKGNAIVTLPWSIADNGTGLSTEGYVWARLRKWDGTTETEIANISGAIISVVSAATSGRIEALKLPIPQTIFKKGDYLRLTAEGYVQSGGAPWGTIRIWHDPKDRTTSITEVPTSTLSLQIPARINL